MWQVVDRKYNILFFKGQTYKQCLNYIKDYNIQHNVDDEIDINNENAKFNIVIED